MPVYRFQHERAALRQPQSIPGRGPTAPVRRAAGSRPTSSQSECYAAHGFASNAVTSLRNVGAGPATYTVDYYYTPLTPKS